MKFQYHTVAKIEQSCVFEMWVVLYQVFSECNKVKIYNTCKIDGSVFCIGGNNVYLM